MAATDNLKDDISFMRRMAEQGRRGPILGGMFLTAAGAIYGAACLIQWALSTHMLPWGEEATSTLWWGTSALFVLVWLVLFMRVRGSGEPGAANFAFAMAWTGSALGIATMAAAVYAVAAKFHDPSMYALLAPMAFAFYGTAWFVSAGMTRKGWMYVVALLAYLSAGALAALAGSTEMLIAMAGSLALTLVVPGVALTLAR